MTTPKRLTMTELAARINVHLKRFEADPVINAPYTYETMKLRHYWHAGAGVSGRRVHVTYISYQGSRGLTRAQAEQYLAWLDAGNVGRHYEAERAARGGAL